MRTTPAGAWAGRIEGVAILLLFAVLAAASICAGEEKDARQKVAVIISRNIRPYVEAAEGLTSAVRENSTAEVQTFFLETNEGGNTEDLSRRLTRDGFDLWAAVGPDSAAFIWNELPRGTAARIYCMVLNPEKALAGAEDKCGVSLNIPAAQQLDVISKGLPGAPRLGILYDPRNNSQFVREAADKAPAAGLKIVALAVSSRKEISAVLRRYRQDMDALWLIPDGTVISESVVQFIIKESLFRNMPVVGYNRFFYDSGAALALVFDYRELGAQTGRLALDVLRGAGCRPGPPLFHVWLNQRVFAKIGMTPPQTLSPPLEWGP